MRAMLYPALLLAPLAASCATNPEAQTMPAVSQDAREAAFARDFVAFAAEIDETIPTLPGLSAVVVRQDGVIAQVHSGMADYEAGVPASQDTRWYIASSTKAFVGAAMAELASRGEIDLGWSLAELAPDVAFAPELRAREVTLRHLLSHTHGLVSGSIEFRLAYSGEHDADTLWRLLGQLDSNEEAPLGSFKYGNLGYNIATMLVERKLGRRWQDIVDRTISAPLGMHATLTQGLDEARAIAPFAAPYEGNRSETRERLYLVKHDRTMHSAGGMYSSAADMGLWLQAQLAAAGGHLPHGLAPAIRDAQVPIAVLKSSFGPFERTGYSMGWYSWKFQGSVLHHAFGSFVGAMAHASFMPEADVGVAAMTNEQGWGAMAPHILATYVYKWFLLGPDAARAEGRELLAEAAAGLAKERSKSIQALSARAQREWQLSLPFTAYAGVYSNPARGTMQITAAERGLSIAMGELRAEGAPFTSPETIRIEAVPGTGITGTFTVENGSVTEFELFGEKFHPLPTRDYIACKRTGPASAEARSKPVGRTVVRTCRSFTEAPGHSPKTTSLTAEGRIMEWLRMAQISWARRPHFRSYEDTADRMGGDAECLVSAPQQRFARSFRPDYRASLKSSVVQWRREWS